MKTLVIAFLPVIIAIAFAAEFHADVRQQFVEFQQTYNKVYKTAEESEYRFQVFKDGLKRASEAQTKNPLAEFGVNSLSDLTPEEFKKFYLMPDTVRLNWVKPPSKNFSIPRPENALGCVPDPVWYSWIDCNGVLTGIYNQGQCGSCWAFSATETIESYAALAGRGLTLLSMQQMVDCDQYDSGCNGGMPTRAFQYVESAGGIESLSEYPYTGYDGSCQFNSNDVVATVTGIYAIDGETGLYQQCSSSSGGPVSVCVDASGWQYYTGGILTSCGDTMDHCVQLIGYKNYGENGAFWIVRNSWGSGWGLGGYIWIAIGSDLCGIGDYASVCSAE